MAEEGKKVRSILLLCFLCFVVCDSTLLIVVAKMDLKQYSFVIQVAEETIQKLTKDFEEKVIIVVDTYIYSFFITW